jgi:hypothetical protein
MIRTVRASILATSLLVALASTVVLATPAATHWVRVEASAAALEQVGGRQAGSVDYGRFQWLAVDDAMLARLRAAGIVVHEVHAPFVLDLGGVRFDPLLQSPPVSTAWSATSASVAGGKDLHLVQFGAPVR